MSKRDFYDILEVSKGASADEIKKSYRKIAMKYHPDRNPGDKAAEDKFKEAAEAYEVLSDGDKKRRYDQFGHAGMGGQQGGFGGGGMRMEDIFSNFGDIFGDDAFGSFFGGGGQGGQRRGQRGGVPGSNLRVKLKLSYDEIVKNTQKTIKVKKYVKCTGCNGSGAKDSNSVKGCATCGGNGQVRRVQNTFLGQMQTVTTCPTCNGAGTQITNKCTTCKGEGRNYGEETINIDVPAGAVEGINLNMSGKGNAGERGGPNGDLHITIEEEKHPDLKREGLNVLYELHLSFPEVCLGTEVEVPTITGKAKIKIPAGTHAGKMLKLKSKGFPNISNNYEVGDQIIHIDVWTPQDLTNEEKSILEKLSNSKNFAPNKAKDGKSFFDKIRDAFG
jgi:molecular chaperone DnaJ